MSKQKPATQDMQRRDLNAAILLVRSKEPTHA